MGSVSDNHYLLWHRYSTKEWIAWIGTFNISSRGEWIKWIGRMRAIHGQSRKDVTANANSGPSPNLDDPDCTLMKVHSVPDDMESKEMLTGLRSRQSLGCWSPHYQHKLWEAFSTTQWIQLALHMPPDGIAGYSQSEWKMWIGKMGTIHGPSSKGISITMSPKVTQELDDRKCALMTDWIETIMASPRKKKERQLMTQLLQL